jgi:hypothetical protein
MSDNVEQAAKELLRLQAELEALEARIKEQKAILIDAVEVGGTVEIDGAPMFRVQQKKDFRLDLAEQVLPAEVITAATVTVEQVDKAKVKAYAEALGLLDGCLKVSEPFVAAVRR